jgi:hypothetical protein
VGNAPGCVREALDMVRAGLGYLATTDPAITSFRCGSGFMFCWYAMPCGGTSGSAPSIYGTACLIRYAARCTGSSAR